MLFTLVPETHAHLYSTDVMTKLTAWTVDSAGKCNHFISIESSYLYNHHIYIDLIDNNDKFDNVINIDISTPVSEKGRYGLKIGYGVGFGDPLTNFTSVTRTQSVVFDHEGGFIRESDGFGINRFVNSGEAFSPHFTVQIELSDDTVMMTAYVCHYKNGNVSISELGWRILIENGITAVFMYADGVHIGAATDTKRAYIDELSFGMAVNLHDASTKYHLYADSMTINGEEVLENVNINADVTA